MRSSNEVIALRPFHHGSAFEEAVKFDQQGRPENKCAQLLVDYDSKRKQGSFLEEEEEEEVLEGWLTRWSVTSTPTSVVIIGAWNECQKTITCFFSGPFSGPVMCARNKYRSMNPF